MIINNIIKGKNGITLVALIITIIVLLILAGVTIGMLFGDNGIIRNSKEAANEYTNKAEQENEMLGKIEDIFQNYISGGNKEPEEPPTEPEPNPTIGDDTGLTVTIPNELTLCSVNESTGIATKITDKNLWPTHIKQVGIMSGLVFMDSIGNEYVWVPVNGNIGGTAVQPGKVNYVRQDFGKQSGSYSDYSETINAEEQESVTKYKGFYVCRYEAGDENATVVRASGASITNPVVSKKGKIVYNYVTRSQAKTLAEGYAVSIGYTNLTSRLISSYAWDAIMNFASINGKDVTDSITWGNHSNSTGAAATNSGSSNMNYTTGRNEAWQVGHIYDIAGNVWEWTTETCSNASYPCVNRGGSYYNAGTSHPASSRNNVTETDSSSNVFGFRPTLFVALSAE